MPIFLASFLLKLSPVGAFFKRIPLKVWLIIGAVLLILAAIVWHGHTVKKALHRADQAGYVRAMHEVRQAQAKADALGAQRKAKHEIEKTRINQEVQAHHDQDTNDIRARASTLRLQHQSEARGSRRPEVLSGVPRGSAPAAREPRANAGLAQVPWLPLIDHSEQCDLDHAALKAWEDWHAKQAKAWPK